MKQNIIWSNKDLDLGFLTTTPVCLLHTEYHSVRINKVQVQPTNCTLMELLTHLCPQASDGALPWPLPHVHLSHKAIVSKCVNAAFTVLMLWL